MRGKVTDQDLTNYALNELQANERLYVESMLALSEECRSDVYQMLELSEMLREGFEVEEDSASLELNDDQRTRVLTVPRWQWRGVFQRVAAVLLLSAGAGYALMHSTLWQSGAAEKLVGATEKLTSLVVDVRDKGFARSAAEYTRARMEATEHATEPAEFQFVSAAMPTPAVCTPPDMGMPEASSADM